MKNDNEYIISVSATEKQGMYRQVSIRVDHPIITTVIYIATPEDESVALELAILQLKMKMIERISQAKWKDLG